MDSMPSDSIPVNAPLLDGNERKYLNECIDSGWISSEHLDPGWAGPAG